MAIHGNLMKLTTTQSATGDHSLWFAWDGPNINLLLWGDYEERSLSLSQVSGFG